MIEPRTSLTAKIPILNILFFAFVGVVFVGVALYDISLSSNKEERVTEIDALFWLDNGTYAILVTDDNGYVRVEPLSGKVTIVRKDVAKGHASCVGHYNASKDFREERCSIVVPASVIEVEPEQNRAVSNFLVQ